MHDGDRSAASPIADRLKGRFDPTFGGVEEYRLGPLPVPSTSIYSRTDGVVRWQVCLDVADDRHENVEVRGSHVGLGFNASARCGWSVTAWVSPKACGPPFRPPTGLRSLYPPAASWHTNGHSNGRASLRGGRQR